MKNIQNTYEPNAFHALLFVLVGMAIIYLGIIAVTASPVSSQSVTSNQTIFEVFSNIHGY